MPSVMCAEVRERLLACMKQFSTSSVSLLRAMARDALPLRTFQDESGRIWPPSWRRAGLFPVARLSIALSEANIA